MDTLGFGAYSAKKHTRCCDWEQYRFFFFYQLPASLTPFLLFDIQMLLADHTRVRRMFHYGQRNCRRNRDRKLLCADHEEDGGVLIREVRGLGPHAALGQSTAP